MKNVNVTITDEASRILNDLKKEWNLKNLSEVVDKLAKNQVKEK